MEITIAHAKLSGTLAVPPSKSYAHRALICAALAKGDSVLHPVAYCDDAAATAHALSAMGLCTIERKGETVFVSGGGQGNAGATIDCNESGSTLRFLLPVSLLFGGNVFSGRGRLMKRPMEPFQQLCAQQGFMMNVVQDEIRLRGMLRDGNYETERQCELAVYQRYADGLAPLRRVHHDHHGIAVQPVCGYDHRGDARVRRDGHTDQHGLSHRTTKLSARKIHGGG